MRARLLSPFWLPVWVFLAGILAGAVALHSGWCHDQNLSWIDSLFTATSALCVTGLVVVDTGGFFNTTGQGVILGLIQLGGLGIMTYTSLALYLLGRKVSLGDRMAVGQTLLHDPGFSLKHFLGRVVLGALCLEAVGALFLNLLDPQGFHGFSAVFHSVSAFCNAGFALQADSLTAWAGNWGVNLVFMVLIVLGGLGFYVLAECGSSLKNLALGRGFRGRRGPRRFTWHTRVVLSTTLALILGGAAAIFLAEIMGGTEHDWNNVLLHSLFSSVTCRTAGFNTVSVPYLTNVTLVIMLVLMFIGGSPGSCAGGIKTTSIRVWTSFVISQLRGRSQVRVAGMGVSKASVSRALTLIVLAGALMVAATLVLSITEGGDVPHNMARGSFLETIFEVISAFGTVGLSMGMTENLTGLGKVVVVCLMFVGRIGPIWLLTALQSWQTDPKYRLPEGELPLG